MSGVTLPRDVCPLSCYKCFGNIIGSHYHDHIYYKYHVCEKCIHNILDHDQSACKLCRESPSKGLIDMKLIGDFPKNIKVTCVDKTCCKAWLK